MLFKCINICLIIIWCTLLLTVQSVTSCRPHCVGAIFVSIQDLELSLIVQFIGSSLDTIIESIIYFLIVGDQIPQSHCSFRMFGCVGDNHAVLGIWKMSNIFYHIGVMDIIFRMKNCLTYIRINVMDLQSSFAVLELGAVGIRQSRFGIETFLIPSCHHFQEFRCFFQLIRSHNGRILC